MRLPTVLVGVAVACLFAARGCRAAEPAAATPYSVINLMPEFWSFYDRSSSLPLDQQARRFRESIVARHPDVYTREVLTMSPEKPFDDTIESRYGLVQHLIADRMNVMRELSDSIGTNLGRYESRFRETFPDLDYRGEVYFLYSVGGFDGATRQVKGKTALMFGLDMMTYVYGREADPEPFFHHELFHLYHRQFAGAGGEGDDENSILASLWREGLATYTAHQLNPSAHGVALFGLPRSTPARVRQDLPKLVRALGADLQSTRPDTYSRYFMGSAEDAETPARCGYVIGYLVAQELARHHRLLELAHTPVRQLEPEIARALAAVAATGATDEELNAALPMAPRTQP